MLCVNDKKHYEWRLSFSSCPWRKFSVSLLVLCEKVIWRLFLKIPETFAELNCCFLAITLIWQRKKSVFCLVKHITLFGKTYYFFEKTKFFHILFAIHMHSGFVHHNIATWHHMTSRSHMTSHDITLSRPHDMTSHCFDITLSQHLNVPNTGISQHFLCIWSSSNSFIFSKTDFALFYPTIEAVQIELFRSIWGLLRKHKLRGGNLTN